MSRGAEVVVIGAGIAGVSVAYHLTAKHGVTRAVLVDPRPPLTLTSDKSTECYRNWWPSREMVGLMNRSIDLLEEHARASGNVFRLNRRGYVYATADALRVRVPSANNEEPSDDPEIRRLTARMEEHIRTCPEQYFWVHQRFKGRPPPLPDFYARRAA